MRIHTFVVGYVLAVALFLFAQRRAEPAQSQGFTSVVDLTTASQPSAKDSGTRIDAPAQLGSGMWTLDQIPAERLVAPLVVLDVSANTFGNADYQVSVEDIANWEHAHGHIPQGAIVMARTGWKPTKTKSAFPGYSEDAAKFLIDARNALSLGIDTMGIDPGQSKDSAVRHYALAHSVYPLENVANLDRVPATGSLGVVAPTKVAGGLSGPVRILALVK
jgi:kynurenine formamidase